jgi:hypothetical protein
VAISSKRSPWNSAAGALHANAELTPKARWREISCSNPGRTGNGKSLQALDLTGILAWPEKLCKEVRRRGSANRRLKCAENPREFPDPRTQFFISFIGNLNHQPSIYRPALDL